MPTTDPSDLVKQHKERQEEAMLAEVPTALSVIPPYYGRVLALAISTRDTTIRSLRAQLATAEARVKELEVINSLRVPGSCQCGDDDLCAIATRAIAAYDAARSGAIPEVWHGKLVRVGTFEQGGETITGFICATTREYIQSIPALRMHEMIAVAGESQQTPTNPNLGTAPHPDTAYLQALESVCSREQLAEAREAARKGGNQP